MGVLAHWHALNWGLGRLDYSFASVPEAFTNKLGYLTEIDHIRASWLQFCEVETEIASEFATLYTPLVEGLANLWQSYIVERFSNSGNLTIVHGDCYFSQIMCPKARYAAESFLIDFDSVCVDLPTDDLVTLLATFWQQNQRLQHEMAVLKHYYKALLSAGIGTYSWDALLMDYRFSILWHMIYPIFGRLAGDTSEFWKLRLRAITEAYKDWHCEQLLQPR